MKPTPPCPACTYEYTYAQDELIVCPNCGKEWTPGHAGDRPEGPIVLDANGNPLSDGDSVIILKTLPVKGAAKPIKAGTKVKRIRLVEGDHNIDCKIDGYGAMALKSEFVKKA